MNAERYEASIYGSGNAVNIGGRNNIAGVNATNPATADVLAAAAKAVRTLAADVDGPTRSILVKGAQEIESSKGENKDGLRVALELVQAAISGVSGTVTSAATATKAIGEAMAAVGS